MKVSETNKTADLDSVIHNLLVEYSKIDFYEYTNLKNDLADFARIEISVFSGTLFADVIIKKRSFYKENLEATFIRIKAVEVLDSKILVYNQVIPISSYKLSAAHDEKLFMKSRNGIKLKTHKTCADDDCTEVFKLFKTTDKYCSPQCKQKNEAPKTSKHYVIPKQTQKQKKALAKYFVVRANFMNSLESPNCPVFPSEFISDVHHKKGREGFADDWARENDIPLLIDTRFFIGVSRKGHEYIENNPVWAKKNGFSLDRL